MGLTVEQLAQKYDLSVDDLLNIAKTSNISLNTKSQIDKDLEESLVGHIESLREKVSLSREKVSQLQVGMKTVTVVTKKKKTLGAKPKINLASIKKKIAETEQLTQKEVKEAGSIEQEASLPARSGESTQTESRENKENHTVVSDTKAQNKPSLEKTTEESAKKPSQQFKKTAEETKKPLKGKKPYSASQEEGETKQKKKKVRRAGALSSENLDKTVLRKITGSIDDADEALEMTAAKQLKKVKKEKHHFTKPVEVKKIQVKISENITVSELAHQMSIKAVNVIKELMKIGVMAKPSCLIDKDTAFIVTEELGHTPIDYVETNPEEHLSIVYQGEEKSRYPVVTIMGHVDHGKTSLLDYLRRSSIADGESGGITQHIGAYCVSTERGTVTFLDTPGHSAFTSMRARGAKCTDIAIIVIAADDGVMPQTKEAIDHAKAAGVPIVIAFNKIDKPDIDLEKIKSQLAAVDLLPEDWGGDAPCIGVSAKTGQGVDDLLQAILLQAELLDLKAPVQGPAQGVVIETSLHRQKGTLTTLLVQQGALQLGDIVVCGQAFGRVKAMKNDQGLPVAGQALPSEPVEVLGLTGQVSAGDKFAAVSSEKMAREIVDFRHENEKKQVTQDSAVSLEDFFNQSKIEVKDLKVLLKADTHGSSEAICDSLRKLSNEEVTVKIISSGVGGINESDVILAKASSAIILGFNTRADKNARDIAEKNGVSLYYYSIIYDLLDNIKASIKGLQAPKFKEQIVGLCQVKDVFRSSVLGNIAGCLVTEGFIKKDLPIRVLRNHVVIYEGVLESLRRFKDEASQVRAGVECGVGVKDYNDIKIGDQIEVFEMIEIEG